MWMKKKSRLRCKNNVARKTVVRKRTGGSNPSPSAKIMTLWKRYAKTVEKFFLSNTLIGNFVPRNAHKSIGIKTPMNCF